MSVSNFSSAAWHAIKAAALRKTHGRAIASQYAKDHNVSGFYRLACQLSAVEGV